MSSRCDDTKQQAAFNQIWVFFYRDDLCLLSLPSFLQALAENVTYFLILISAGLMKEVCPQKDEPVLRTGGNMMVQ